MRLLILFLYFLHNCHGDLILLEDETELTGINTYWTKKTKSSPWKKYTTHLSNLYGYRKTSPGNRLLVNITIKFREIPDDCINTTKCLLIFSYYSIQQKSTSFDDTKVNDSINIPHQLMDNVTSKAYTKEIFINDMDNMEGLMIQFKATKFQGQISMFNISYYQCSGISTNFIKFDKIPAPSEPKTIVVNGSCTENSETEKQDIQMNCSYNGSFTTLGSCVCKAGYEPNGGTCRGCSDVHYKNKKGNVQCTKCGENSKSGSTKRSCECEEHFHREKGKENLDEENCYESPRWIGDLKEAFTYEDLTSTSVTIQWKEPQPGSGGIGDYILKCTNCPPNNKIDLRTNKTNVKFDSLSAFATYNMTLTNVNNITLLTGIKNKLYLNFKTKKGAPSMVSNPKYVTRSDGSVEFIWGDPFGLGSDDYTFIVTYGDKTIRLKKKHSFVIKTDTQDRTYNVEIYTEAVFDGKIWKGEIFKTTVTVNGGIPLELTLAIAFSILIFIVIVLIVIFCIWKKRNPAYLQVVRMLNGTVKLPSRFYSGGKTYVDPKTYPDVDHALNEFAFEIKRDELKLAEMIGEGEFCEVYKGVLFRSTGSIDVAVKMLKSDSSRQDRNDFMSEATILGQFADPNVIELQGIMKEQANAIVLEYMCHGSLDIYLREHDNEFTVIELLEMGRGISSGMKYLSELGFIHRDLAARNVLVNDQKECKISDFGMSIEITYEEMSDKNFSNKVPVRWTAPEAIQFKQFTTASDIWSYGIVLWEIFSYGERPYGEWSNYEVVEKVSANYRLPPPMNCPSVVHDLMLQCWTKDRTRRPLFGVIRQKLESWIRHPDLLEGYTVIGLDDNLDYTIMQTVNKWLEAIEMGRYTSNFLEQGYATPRQLLLLNYDHLEKLGIGPVEHRKRIMKAIETTRKQVEAKVVRAGSVIENKYIA